VSLAWFSSADLYLSRGLVMYKSGKNEALCLDFPATMSWDRVLEKLIDRLKDSSTSNPLAKNLRVTISGALCQAIAVPAPPEITAWSDLQQLLLASATSTLEVKPEYLCCELDSYGTPIGAALSTALMQSLQTWTATQRVRVISISPTWALATQCKAARDKKVSALEISEPDGVTFLTTNDSTWAASHVFKSQTDPASHQASLRRHRIGMLLEEAELLKMSLQREASQQQKNTPMPWRDHWSVV
jgi:hypothetical protein